MEGPARREALTAFYDSWLSQLFPVQTGTALVAVGGLGRREPAPYGDLDLVLIHTGQRFVDHLAEEVWYPIWDAGFRLDHSVRTVDEALTVAKADLRAAIGLLDLRHIAGDRDLAAELLSGTRALWRSTVDSWLPALDDSARRRWADRGAVGTLSEPDLKESRGGLRDIQLIRAIAAAQIAQPQWGRLRPARRTLLDVRDGLQITAGRPTSMLVMQEQREVARIAGYPDSDELHVAVAAAARTVSYICGETLRAAHRWRRPARAGRAMIGLRRPLSNGVVEQDGEVHLARAVNPNADPALPLRVGAAAARTGLPIAEVTLEQLAASRPRIPEPWAEDARTALVDFLGAGPGLVAAWEALDEHGLIERLLPVWPTVRSRPQRSPVHRFTVDRHLLETVVEAGRLVREVGRPDLLLVSALLHDIGKGRGGDHSVIGAELAQAVAVHMGLPDCDVDVVARAVRHHLLLPVTATRRDPDDPATTRLVADAVHGSGELLELLRALAEADGRATGPAAWTPWKSAQIADLAERTRRLLRGTDPPPPWQPDRVLVAAARAGGVAVAVGGDHAGDCVQVATTARPRLLAGAAGAAALHRLDVIWARSATVGEVAALSMGVRPRFGEPPDSALLAGDLRRAVAGELPLQDWLARRDSSNSRAAAPAPPAPRVLWIDEATDASILELRASDRPGLLHRVAAALERCGADIRAARISTLGSDVVDAFYLAGRVAEPDRCRMAAAVIAAAAPPDLAEAVTMDGQGEKAGRRRGGDEHGRAGSHRAGT